MDFLDFEQPIVELEKRIEELKLTAANSESSVDLNNEINNSVSYTHLTLPTKA